MQTTIAKMTRAEFSELISSLIEQKLLELFGDPDENLPIRQSLRKRLSHQRKAVARGLRGEKLDVVVNRLGLK